MDITAKESGTGRGCTLRFHPDGLYFLFGKKYTASTWAEVRQVSFDDLGRTRANAGAVALFGVAGLASRRSVTVVTAVLNSATWQFEAPFSLGQLRASLRELAQEIPVLASKLYINGQLPDRAGAAPSSSVSELTEAGWYPDPLGLPRMRWFDGSSWTDNTAALPPPPS